MHIGGRSPPNRSQCGQAGENVRSVGFGGLGVWGAGSLGFGGLKTLAWGGLETWGSGGLGLRLKAWRLGGGEARTTGVSVGEWGAEPSILG